MVRGVEVWCVVILFVVAVVVMLLLAVMVVLVLLAIPFIPAAAFASCLLFPTTVRGLVVMCVAPSVFVVFVILLLGVRLVVVVLLLRLLMRVGRDGNTDSGAVAVCGGCVGLTVG